MTHHIDHLKSNPPELQALKDRAVILIREIAQLRQDRDHLDQQHRFILTEKNNLQAERDGMSHDLKQVREALGCDGSDLPQLLGAIDGLKSELLNTLQKLPTTAQAMVYQSLLMKFKSAESRLKELELPSRGVSGWQAGARADLLALLTEAHQLLNSKEVVWRIPHSVPWSECRDHWNESVERVIDRARELRTE